MAESENNASGEARSNSQSPTRVRVEELTTRAPSPVPLGESETFGHLDLSTPSPDAPYPKIPGYDIEDQIGSGGMGVVYRAKHLGTDRSVALKVLNTLGTNEPALKERFTREVRSLARVQHGNVVGVYDAGIANGLPYLSMTLVEGGTLARHLKRLRGDRVAACKLLAKIARAVAALHKTGVLHRDLKPHNILVAAGDEPFVADFGLVHWMGTDSTLSVTNTPIGTRPYMSPEQTLGRKTDYAPSADIWSLGVMMYEALCGVRPFTDDDPVRLMLAVRQTDPPRFAKHDPTLPEELEAVCFKCLEKRPQARYADASELADDLERWLAGQKVHAPKRGRLKKGRLGLAALALLIGSGVAVAATWGGKPKAEPTEPVQTAGLLADGNPLELVGATGGAKVPLKAIEGVDESGTDIDETGHLKLTTSGFRAVAFDLRSTPGPATLEGEVAVTRFVHPQSKAGFVLRSVTAPAPGGRRFGLLGFAVTGNDSLPEDQRTLAAGVSLRVWETGVSANYTGIGTTHRIPRDPPRSLTDIRWHRFSVTVTGAGLEPIWNQTPKPFGLVSAKDINDEFRGRGLASTETAPYADDRVAFGLFAEGCEALFRNVRLVPIPKAE